MILVSAIKEITGVSWIRMFPDGYSVGILTWSDHDDFTDQTFHDMAGDFPRLEKFGAQGPVEVHSVTNCGHGLIADPLPKEFVFHHHQSHQG